MVPVRVPPWTTVPTAATDSTGRALVLPIVNHYSFLRAEHAAHKRRT